MRATQVFEYDGRAAVMEFPGFEQLSLHEQVAASMEAAERWLRERIPGEVSPADIRDVALDLTAHLRQELPAVGARLAQMLSLAGAGVGQLVRVGSDTAAHSVAAARGSVPRGATIDHRVEVTSFSPYPELWPRGRLRDPFAIVDDDWLV